VDIDNENMLAAGCRRPVRVSRNNWKAAKQKGLMFRKDKSQCFGERFKKSTFDSFDRFLVDAMTLLQRVSPESIARDTRCFIQSDLFTMTK
jgi:hypothetical protein